MTLETWFYYVGIAYFSFAFLFLLALGVGVYIAYQKWMKLQQRVKQSAMAVGALKTAGALPFKKLAPMLAALPFVFKIIGSLKKNR